jgi:hypothetical protein
MDVEVTMQATWTYNTYDIREGLKPGSDIFRFFMSVFENGEKKCNFCVWIKDDALARFDPSKDFEAIVSHGKAQWHQWVKQKLDDGDFRNRALKFEKNGQKEIDLSAMNHHVGVD